MGTNAPAHACLHVAGVRREELLVRPRGEEAEVFRLEQQGGDGAFVQSIGSAQLEARLVLALEDGDIALAGPGDEPLSCRIGSHDDEPRFHH